MTASVSAPHIYEINTWTWLHELSQKYDEPITLGTIPEAEIHALLARHIDMVWLMGVWMRSPRGVRIAITHPGLRSDYDRALHDWSEADVVGSPYGVADYKIAPQLGTRGELAFFRAQLKKHGVGLLLDYVPNHIATDHPWTTKKPDALMQGTPSELAQDSDSFFAVGENVFANGRDPYFPAWTDTAQLNAFSPTLRKATIDTLREIAGQCDGVRCDMAMLMTNSVFSKTWGKRAGAIPQTEFWEEIIPAIKSRAPEFLFIAEVYWGMEGELLQQGFDYCYDKSLYDVLERGTATELQDHLAQPLRFQQHLVRFIENHDEKRAVTAFGFNRAWMSAVLIATLPGVKLWHEGQFVGHRVKLPVQLGRRPVEADDTYLDHFYQMLLREVTQPLYRDGRWEPGEIQPAWAGNATYRQLIAYTWQLGNELRLIIINFGESHAQGLIKLRRLDNEIWELRDILNNKAFQRQQLNTSGLFIDLNGWNGHLFIFKRV